MARRTLPLLSQKQVDQAIKNFIVEPNPKSTKVRLCLNGGTAISFEIYKDYVRAYRAKKKHVGISRLLLQRRFRNRS